MNMPENNDKLDTTKTDQPAPEMAAGAAPAFERKTAVPEPMAAPAFSRKTAVPEPMAAGTAVPPPD